MNHARYLNNGKLVIFKRGRIFQSRHKFETYVYRTLRTTDPEEAVVEAWKKQGALEQEIARGGAVTHKTFSKVIDAYIAARTKDCQHGRLSKDMLRQIMRVSKFWREFVGSKPIHKIGNKELTDFIPWRREYYHRHQTLPGRAKRDPADKTLLWELTLARMIIRWAHNQGWRGGQPLPTFTFKVGLKRARPAFSMPEYLLLIRTLRKRIRSAPDNRIRDSRLVLLDYVLILANSGLRVGELNSLRIRDIEKFTDTELRQNFRLNVSGKTGERDVVPRANSEKPIGRQLERRKDAAPNDYLFVTANGTKVTTFFDSFSETLMAAGLVLNSKGRRLTLYSLRHMYAVQHLKRGIPVYTVARNMGTSVKMIELHYARDATSMEMANLLAN